MPHMVAKQYFNCRDYQDPSLVRVQHSALRSTSIELDYQQRNPVGNILALLPKTLFAFKQSLGLGR